MAKFFSILLSGLIFVQSFNISLMDLSKLQTMIDHLDYHQDNFDESFGDFIAIHYSSDQILHDDDHEHHNEHEELPFKNDLQTTQNSFNYFIFNKMSIDFDVCLEIEVPLNFHYKESYSQYEKPPILQPPRLV